MPAIIFITMLLAIFPGSAGCSRLSSGDSPVEVLALDLIAQVPQATIVDSAHRRKADDCAALTACMSDPWSGMGDRIVKIGFDMDDEKKFYKQLRAIHLGAFRNHPCSIAYALHGTDIGNATLSFSLAGSGLIQGSCRFSITLDSADGSRVLFDSKRDEKALAEKKWQAVDIDLPNTASDNAHLRLQFTASSQAVQHIFMGRPRIYRRSEASHGSPNVVYVVIDALRADAVHCVNPRFSITPAIDALARDGAVFTKHFVSSNWTRPSTMNLLTGRYASSTGVNFYYAPVHDEEKKYFYTQSGVRPITTLLRSRGYATRAIGNNAFLLDCSGIGIDLDFDELSEYQTIQRDTIDITDEAVRWLNNNHRRKFFLMLNYNGPHNPYSPPSRYYVSMRNRYPAFDPMFSAYLGEVSYTDEHLGRVIAEIKRLGLYKETVIVVSSDHGEIFTPAHGMSMYTDVESMYTHGQTQYDEELQVPLVIKGPGSHAVRQPIVHAQVRSIDIVPTLLDFLGMQGSLRTDGESLIPFIAGKETADRIVYSEGRMMYSVRAGGFKYAERFYGFGIKAAHWGGDQVKEYSELYDLARDPGENVNIGEERPDIVKRMQGILRQSRFRQSEHVLGCASKKISGRIRIERGFFYDITLSGKSGRLRRINRKEYAFELHREDRILFQAIPDMPLIHLATEDGTTVLCGKDSLPTARKTGVAGFEIASVDGSCHGAPDQEVQSLIDRGLLYWNQPCRTSAREARSEKYLTRNVNRLLKDWGYIQGKEKRE